jgi:hypothetical protein
VQSPFGELFGWSGEVVSAEKPKGYGVGEVQVGEGHAALSRFDKVSVRQQRLPLCSSNGA